MAGCRVDAVVVVVVDVVFLVSCTRHVQIRFVLCGPVALVLDLGRANQIAARHKCVALTSFVDSC